MHHYCDGSSGAVATDFDGDGRLELLVSHGESAAQPLSVYKVNLVSVPETNLERLSQTLSRLSVTILTQALLFPLGLCLRASLTHGCV